MDNEQSEIPQEDLQTDLVAPVPDKTDEPAYTHRGNGMVARLPKKYRDELCFMILDGVPFTQIPQRLGEAGKDLTVEHIRKWFKYSYKHWLAEYNRNQALRDARENAMDLLTEKAGVPVQEAGRTIASAQLYELLKSFNPTAFAESLAEKPELYLRLIGALSRLSEGEAVCSHRTAQDSLSQAKLQTTEPGAGPKIISEQELKELAKQIKLL